MTTSLITSIVYCNLDFSLCLCNLNGMILCSSFVASKFLIPLTPFLFVYFCKGNTRSSTHLKLKHSLSKTNATSHLYFNRLPQLWNSLPPINPKHSIPTIKNQFLQVFWSHFTSHFLSTNPCSFHYCCPCAKCVPLSVVTPPTRTS